MREILPCQECIDLGFSGPITGDEQQAFDDGAITMCPGRTRRAILRGVEVLDQNDRLATLTKASVQIESDVCPEGISEISLPERLLRSVKRSLENIS